MTVLSQRFLAPVSCVGMIKLPQFHLSRGSGDKRLSHRRKVLLSSVEL